MMSGRDLTNLGRKEKRRTARLVQVERLREKVCRS
jgi:hypothetical protein